VNFFSHYPGCAGPGGRLAINQFMREAGIHYRPLTMSEETMLDPSAVELKPSAADTADTQSARTSTIR
jgi:hypothetical protein